MLSVGCGATTLALRLLPDDDPRAGALLRLHGHRLDYVDTQLDEVQRAMVEGLRRALRGREGDPPGALADALAAVRAVAAAEGWELRGWRRVALDQAAFVSEPVHRRGWPAAAGDAALPFDAELAGLLAGLRRVIKREASRPEVLAADRAWLEAQGLQTRLVAHPGGHQRGVLLASGERGALTEALALEQAQAAGGHGWQETVRAMGALLGYPPCCVRAMAAVRVHDDASLFALRLGAAAPGRRPAPALFLGLLALISHLPCAPECAATAALGEALLAALEGRRAGFAARWRRRAERLHLIDRRGRLFALRAEAADPAGPLVVHDALRYRGAGAAGQGQREPAEAAVPALVGARLWRRDGWLVPERPDLPLAEAAFHADHQRRGEA
jgi:hypothetical protein